MTETSNSGASTSGGSAAAAAQQGAVGHTQTIAAPLTFIGNDPPLQGELTAQDFLRQLEVRILGARLAADADKLAFALNALQGRAHEWYVGLQVRGDYEDTFEYFKNKFCHKYRIPGYLPQEFDFSLIAKQRIDEDPTQYVSRISHYLTNAAPADSFVTFTAADRVAFDMAYADKISGEDVAAARRPVREIAILCGKRWAQRMQAFHIRHIWLNGLLQPYSDIARAQDRDKELGALIDKVHDEGAARILRANFSDHASAMRAYSSRSGSAHNRPRPVAAVASSSSPSSASGAAPRGPAPSGSPAPGPVAVASSPSKFCRYCKKKGHLLEECHKRARRNAAAASGSASAATRGQSTSSSGPSKKPDPAMQQLFKSWCAFVAAGDGPTNAHQDFQ